MSALPIESNCLGIAGVADLVEYSQDATGETAYPVEFKRGKPKAHRADQAQLCAQALCLEEMTGRPVPEGALFYAETKRRTPVMFDAELRRLTIDAIIALTQVFASRLTPPPTSLRSRCRACSLSEACRPDLAGKNVRAWRRRMVEITANEGAA